MKPDWIYTGKWKWANGLSVRAINCLASAGIHSKAGVARALKSGKIPTASRPLTTIRNYGWKTHKEICRWLGVVPPRDHTPVMKPCPHCGMFVSIAAMYKQDYDPVAYRKRLQPDPDRLARRATKGRVPVRP